MTALSFRSGATRTEGYRYRPFGETTVLDGGGADITASTAGAGNEGNAYRFQGRRFDHEEGSGLYYCRTRFLDPAIGRFISKDSIGDWGDPGNVGNGMTFCGNDPVNCVDPFGLEGGALDWVAGQLGLKKELDGARAAVSQQLTSYTAGGVTGLGDLWATSMNSAKENGSPQTCDVAGSP